MNNDWIAYCGVNCAACPDFPCAGMREFYGESASHEAAYTWMQSLRENR